MSYYDETGYYYESDPQEDYAPEDDMFTYEGKRFKMHIHTDKGMISQYGSSWGKEPDIETIDYIEDEDGKEVDENYPNGKEIWEAAEEEL